jgi:hypothetical protein
VRRRIFIFACNCDAKILEGYNKKPKIWSLQSGMDKRVKARFLNV